MDRKIKRKRAPSIILVACIFILSILCWVSFADTIIGKLADTKKTDTDNYSAGNNMSASELSGDFGEAASDTENNIGGLSALCGKIDNYIDKAENKWQEAFFRKEEFGEIDSVITYLATREISSSEVLQGKDNWLFFSTTTDGNPIEDYEGKNSFSDKQLENAFEAVKIVQDEIESRGLSFTLFIAPNKESVYFEKMPVKYVRCPETRTDKLVEYLSDNGINVVSPKLELLQQHTDYQLYYPQDTHWNNLGGYVGVDCLLNYWGMQTSPLSEKSIIADSKHVETDLVRTAGVSSVFPISRVSDISGEAYQNTNSLLVYQEEDGISFYSNEKAENTETVFLIGDSFRNAMIPTLVSEFSGVYVVHKNAYSPDMLEKIRADKIVVEYVERYSDTVAHISSLMFE